MSMYPAGVSGLEDEIAGPRFERDETREVDECSRLGEFVIHQPFWLRHLRVRGRRVTGRVCTFEGGEVKGTLVGWRSSTEFDWVCPSCGSDNEIEVNQ